MSEDSKRSLLSDIGIFLLLVGLGLLAIYFSGNWEWFMIMLESFFNELMDFVNMFVSNVGSVAGSVNQSALEISNL